MIDYIKGEVAEISPTSATLETNGIGYQMNISLNTYGAINDKSSAKLYVYESIREDTYQLFGFMDKHERELFMMLISVSGVGPSIRECYYIANSKRDWSKNSPACYC